MNGIDELAGLRVGLSGAVPSQAASGEPCAWNAHDIMVTVTRLTQRVLAAGGVLLHGAHPTFLPLIEASARSTPRMPGRPDRQVELFVVVPFLNDVQFREFFVQRRHDDYAVVHPFGTRESDQVQELERMRDALIASCDVLVSVGGELHVKGRRRPGVFVEVEKARASGVPVLLAGAAGGATRELLPNDTRSTMTARNGDPVHRRFDDDAGDMLDESPTVATSRIMEEIGRLRALRRTATPDPPD